MELSTGLHLLADWFDAKQDEGLWGTSREVQKDLRKWASRHDGLKDKLAEVEAERNKAVRERNHAVADRGREELVWARKSRMELEHESDQLRAELEQCRRERDKARDLHNAEIEAGLSNEDEAKTMLDEARAIITENVGTIAAVIAERDEARVSIEPADSGPITFPPADGSWGTITHFGIFAPTGWQGFKHRHQSKWWMRWYVRLFPIKDSLLAHGPIK